MELAVLRVTNRLGLTLAQWDSLPEQERIDRLAFEYRRSSMLDTLLESYMDASKREDGKMYIDWSAYLALKVEQI